MMIPTFGGMLVIIGIAIVYGLILMIRIEQAKDDRRNK